MNKKVQIFLNGQDFIGNAHWITQRASGDFKKRKKILITVISYPYFVDVDIPKYDIR